MRAVWKDFGVVVYDTKNKNREDKNASKRNLVSACSGGLVTLHTILLYKYVKFHPLITMSIAVQKGTREL